MNHKFHLSLFVTLSFVLGLTSCKKDKETGPSQDEINLEIAGQADDQAQLSFELDATLTDASFFLEALENMAGDESVLDQAICDATVVTDYESDPKTVTITYNGENCSLARTRTGTVTLAMPKNKYWMQPGTVVTITYENFKVTRKADQKSITINGSKSYTNITGGLSYGLYFSEDVESIKHSVTSDNISVKINDGTETKWHIARRYEITYNNNTQDIQVAISGLHTEGSVTDIAEWGTNRFGKSFVTSIEAPVVISFNCDKRVISGKVKHTTAAYAATVTFGLNMNGQPVSSCPEGKYYYKAEWLGANNTTFNATIAY